jgi:N-acetylglucosaminyl-diphospho-decaprenol L-rhamnosyltransferase
MKVSVIIVTYNSQNYIDSAMRALNEQGESVHQIIIVDTGSENLHYLDAYKGDMRVQILAIEKESGFCCGNNVGYQLVDASADYVMLLNPDAFLGPGYFKKAIEFMQKHPKAGAVSGKTLGYDIRKNQPTGLYDTTGIFVTWYGRWYDRGQGQEVTNSLYTELETVPAICGAVYFARKAALDCVLLTGKAIFDPSFYMYKEDIDLSLRLRRAGWTLWYYPELVAYHCRGWNSDRSKMQRLMRLCSARNDLRINLKRLQPIGVLYSLTKYLAVLFFDL